MLPVFDPCITRIPPKRLQELRGRVEHWSNCNMSLGPEVRFIDRLLVPRSGITWPNGSSSEIKQPYIDFWTCLGTIRAHMATDTFRSQSYTTDFTGALTLDEQFPMPGARGRLVWAGSDAKLHQCATVDYASRMGAVFSFDFRQLRLASLAGFPLSDFALIAISEFLSFIFFVRSTDFSYRGKFLAYVGDNSNVASWIKHKKT